MQIVVEKPSVYTVDMPGTENWHRHIVPLRYYRHCGNASSNTSLIFSIRPRDGYCELHGQIEEVTLAEIFSVLGNTSGRFARVQFVNLNGEWDHRLNSLFNFLVLRTKELHFCDCRTQDYLLPLHASSFDDRCCIETIRIYENEDVTREKSRILFHALAQMQQLRYLQVDGKFPAEYSNQLCVDLMERLRHLRGLEELHIINTAFDTLGNDAYFSDLLFVAATQAQVSKIVAMSERNADERGRERIHRRYLNFSSLADICCHEDSKQLRSIHLRYVHISPNNRCETRKARNVEMLDFQHAFHVNQAGNHNTIGDQGLLDATREELLRFFPNLRILRLNFCRVQNTGSLVWYLGQKEHQLTELLLEYNQIGRGDFLFLIEGLPYNKTLRYLSVRGNPCEHNLNTDDKRVYFSRLFNSSLVNFPIDGGKDQQEWIGNYRKLTPHLCFNQISHLLDSLKNTKDGTVPVPPGLWPHLLRRFSVMGVFTILPGVDWASQVPYESVQTYFKSLAFFASNKKSMRVDMLNAVYTLLTKNMNLMHAMGNAGQQLHEPTQVVPASSLDDVMAVIDLHQATKTEETLEQCQLDLAIAMKEHEEQKEY